MPDLKPFPFRLEFPDDLPISARSDEIVAALREHSVIILAGETGSGKTTQLPKLCLAAGRGERGRIACTQPRRVAALSVSRRVAEEMNVAWGRQVGCKVRFDDRTSRDTVVKFMTDGMLLAEVQSDPSLRQYDTIIIDEAHERSLNIDFLLGHLRRLIGDRPELRVVITSATIDTAAFSKAFAGAPVIEVSGRTYPVEVIYEPLDEPGPTAKEGAAAPREPRHYVDGAVEAVERILAGTTQDDVLVFMPAERDIRETIGRLAGAARDCELIALFGRLSNQEQQRVFAATPRRRVIVATNIAETSLTLPGIRYVVDTGLARVSRYSPQSRTRRLPIEAVARSSANQRMGRAGRVAQGVCIRLYSEEDYLGRPQFTQPEIQRTNLAEVILRMKAFGLGDIEDFPFLNLPSAQAVRAGYALLDELHAMEGTKGRRTLTDLGRELARLPVDPSVGRMILQARREKALREVVIIAAGLSIQDPRERPQDQLQAADAANRRFTHAASDFLTLLAIWETWHDQFETLSQSRLRRWCRDHFLSYARLREWRDIHHQLHEALRTRDDLAPSSVWQGTRWQRRPAAAVPRIEFDHPAFRAIHRSILAGLLGNVAVRDEDRGGYRATHGRRAVIFPGSGLFRRSARKAKGSKPASPRWLMSAEFMETFRLYARTCARLDPRWILDLGQHLLKVSHHDPFWDEEQGRVLVKRRTRLYGLEIEVRSVGYGSVDPARATDIFIREALLNDTIKWPFDFLMHNRAVRAEVEHQLTRLRDGSLMNLDEAIWRFYTSRLPDRGHLVSAVDDLIALVKERRPHEPRFLEFEAADLWTDQGEAPDASAYPATLPMPNAVLPLHYLYKPGAADDGVTLEIDPAAAVKLTAAELDWAVPGYLPTKVEHYLRGLPKKLRRVVMPLAATARSLVEPLMDRDQQTERGETVAEALADLLGQRFELRVNPAIWAPRPLPDHLQVRVRVVDEAGREIVASRDLARIKLAVEHDRHEASQRIARDAPAVWEKARRAWETEPLDGWPSRELPAEVVIGNDAGVPIKAYPALTATPDGVVVRLHQAEDDARQQGASGLRALLAHVLRRDLAWLQRDLKALKALAPLASTLGSGEWLQEDAYLCLVAWLTDPDRFPGQSLAGTRDQFQAVVALVREDARRAVPPFIAQLREILERRQALLVHPTPYPGLSEDVAELLGPRFLREVPFAQLSHLSRYLQARQWRADRWHQDPAKDAIRVAEVEPWARIAREQAQSPGAVRLRWLVEELRVSLWAQHLGTAEPVSAKKLQRVVEALPGPETAGATAEREAAPPPQSVAPTARQGKSAPVKSLRALGQLFPPRG